MTRGEACRIARKLCKEHAGKIARLAAKVAALEDVDALSARQAASVGGQLRKLQREADALGFLIGEADMGEQHARARDTAAGDGAGADHRGRV